MDAPLRGTDCLSAGETFASANGIYEKQYAQFLEDCKQRDMILDGEERPLTALRAKLPHGVAFRIIEATGDDLLYDFFGAMAGYRAVTTKSEHGAASDLFQTHGPSQEDLHEYFHFHMLYDETQLPL